MHVTSTRALRFPHPDRDETFPLPANTLTEAPDWIADTLLYRLAMSDGTLAVAGNAPEGDATPTPQTLEALQAYTEALQDCAAQFGLEVKLVKKKAPKAPKGPGTVTDETPGDDDGADDAGDAAGEE